MMTLVATSSAAVLFFFSGVESSSNRGIAKKSSFDATLISFSASHSPSDLDGGPVPSGAMEMQDSQDCDGGRPTCHSHSFGIRSFGCAAFVQPEQKHAMRFSRTS